MDDADFAADRLEEIEADRVAAIRRNAAKIEAGEAGECNECSEFFARIVAGHCARCRDVQARKARYNGVTM